MDEVRVGRRMGKEWLCGSHTMTPILPKNSESCLEASGIAFNCGLTELSLVVDNCFTCQGYCWETSERLETSEITYYLMLVIGGKVRKQY